MMNKPHILCIATFPPPVHGAAVVSEQIRKSRVINESFDCDYVNIGTSRTIAEIGDGGLLPTQRYDLCYCAITCHGSGFLKDAPYVLLCKIFRRKVVIHQHNKGMAKDVDRPVYRWLLPLVYIILSVFVFPSNNETFGLVNLEAMSYKLPIVTTNVGGIPDVVTHGENGFVNEPGDADSLASSLCTLLGDALLREKMGEAGYKKFNAHFTEACFENRLAAILKCIVGNLSERCGN